MLYDPKWGLRATDRKTILATFIAWLETQNPSDTYDYPDCDGGCLVGKYLVAHGEKWINAGGPIQTTMATPLWAALHGVAVRRPWTFDAALERARVELAR